jgi:hypothetical protein
MLELNAELWDLYDKGETICITTNGAVNRNGECVMGRGCAAQAKRRFPKLAAQLGTKVRLSGNYPMYFGEYGLFTFPVKHSWEQPADLKLIAQSAEILAAMREDIGVDMIRDVYLPRPGCGNGKLKWEDVKPWLEPYGDWLVVVDNGKGGK